MTTMNIYQKLQEARCRLQELSLKKSGKNNFAGYSYYELGDILPPINNINRDLGLCTHVTFNNEFAILNIINSDDGKILEFTSPMSKASLKGAHDIQNLGAVETYQRRYLYMSAYEIVEHDAVDSSKGKAPKELIDTNKIPSIIKEIQEKSTVQEVKQFWSDFEAKYVTNARIKEAVIARGKELTDDTSVPE
jgi:hypothetical protein